MDNKQHIENNGDTKKCGHWIICSDGYYPYCSKCGQEPQNRVMTPFCPNCGVKMDGDKNV